MLFMIIKKRLLYPPHCFAPHIYSIPINRYTIRRVRFYIYFIAFHILTSVLKSLFFVASLHKSVRLSHTKPIIALFQTSLTMDSTSISSINNNNTQKEFGGKFKPDEHNVLQKHVVFFDLNKDGIVYPSETFKGFRRIGCGIGLSTAAALFINIGLSQKTRPGKFPSVLFPIEIKNIHLAKHGSDSGVYDTEGRLVPSKFEEIFNKHSRTHHNALTSDELMGMLKANRVPKDYAGWLASYVEWKILYVLCKDKKGLLQKETIRAAYDGSLFEQMEKEHSATKKNNTVVV